VCFKDLWFLETGRNCFLVDWATNF
jgi:hypothetical protein